LVAGLCTAAHSDCHQLAGADHAAATGFCAFVDHVGSHAEPFEPCHNHHVLDACVTAARQASARDLPADHGESFLPTPPAPRVTPCLHEPTWPTDSGSALSLSPDRAPPAA